MSKQVQILLGLALLLIGFFYWMGASSTKSKFDWKESDFQGNAYSEVNQQPYGSAVFHKLLEDYFPGKTVTTVKKSLFTELPLSSEQKSTYIFIGGGLFLDSLDTQHLIQYVKRGNTALIISKTIPFDLMNLIYYNECPESPWVNDYINTGAREDTVHVGLLTPNGAGMPDLYFAVQNKPKPYQWAHIPQDVFCNGLPYRPLGYLMRDSFVNFARFPTGSGHFLLHSTPLAFSNFHLLRPEVQKYVSGVLSHIPEGPIYWDSFSRVAEQVSRQRNNNRSDSGEQLPSEHALTYILKEEPLAWAWYLLLGLAILFVLFRALRKQRHIPVLPKNENSSYEFISTIANLHFRERNFRGISVQAMRLFLGQIRERYGLLANLDPATLLVTSPDAEYFAKLAKRSGVNEQELMVIFKHYEALARYEMSEQHLIDFYLSIEEFWKKAK